MADQSVISGDLVVRGAIRAGSMVVPNGSVGNTQFSSTDPLAASKQEHQFVKELVQSGNAAAATQVLHVAYGDGEVLAVRAGSVVAATGDSTVTVDVKKNGTTILSGTILLDNANVAYTPESGTASVSTYSADDVLTAVVTVSAGSGTLPTGLFVQVVLREDAA